MDARPTTTTTKTRKVGVQAAALAIVRRERHRPGGRPAFLMALHDLYRYYAAAVAAAAARRRRVTTTTANAVESKTHEEEEDESDGGDGYESFGEMCAKELLMDRRAVRMAIKEALVGNLFCAMVAGEFGDSVSDDKGDSNVGASDDKAARAALRRQRDVQRIAAVAPSAYRCVVALFNEWQGRDDWIDTSREALEAWFAAPARRRLRDIFASIWTRAKAIAGPGVRPTRQHFATAYIQERASSSASSPPPSSPPSPSSSLGKRKRRTVSSPSAHASIARAPCPDSDGGTDDDDDGDGNREIDHNHATKSRSDHDNGNEMEDDETLVTDDEEDDDDDEDDDGDNLVSPTDVCGTGLAGRPVPTATTMPCFEARSPAPPLCSGGAEAIVVTDALGRQYTLTPVMGHAPLQPPSLSSHTPPTRRGSPNHTGHQRSTMTMLSAPAPVATITATAPVASATTMTPAHQKVGSPYQHHQAAPSLSSSSTEEDAEALRLEAALAQCARAVQRECAAGAPSDARSAGAVDGGPPLPTTTTTTTTTASAAAKRDLFDAISACMRYVADKTRAPGGESAPKAADWLRASCAEDVRPDESAAVSAAAPSEPERRQRWHARRMLVGCLRAMAMLGDPCFAMAVVASLGDDLAAQKDQQRRRHHQRQQQSTLTSPPPERE